MDSISKRLPWPLGLNQSCSRNMAFVSAASLGVLKNHVLHLPKLNGHHHDLASRPWRTNCDWLIWKWCIWCCLQVGYVLPLNRVTWCGWVGPLGKFRRLPKRLWMIACHKPSYCILSICPIHFLYDMFHLPIYVHIIRVTYVFMNMHIYLYLCRYYFCP